MSLLKSAFAVFLAAPVFGADTLAPDQSLIVHEWGTFTSVAGEVGAAVQWAPPVRYSGSALLCASSRAGAC
jgi:hypothetical protein